MIHNHVALLGIVLDVIIPEFRDSGQEDHKLDASLDYMVRPCLKKQKETKVKQTNKKSQCP
jgi:hypothetical protein